MWKWSGHVAIAILASGMLASCQKVGEWDKDDAGTDPTSDPVDDHVLDPSWDPVADDGGAGDPGHDVVTDGGGDTAADPGPEPSAGNVGDGCSVDADCVGVPSSERVCLHQVNLMGLPIDLPGGYCTMPCETDADCPSTTTCLEFYWLFRCQKRCTTAYDCRHEEGYVCHSITSRPEHMVCTPYEVASI